MRGFVHVAGDVAHIQPGDDPPSDIGSAQARTHDHATRIAVNAN
jgi:hypothetical protein